MHLLCYCECTSKEFCIDELKRNFIQVSIFFHVILCLKNNFHVNLFQKVELNKRISIKALAGRKGFSVYVFTIFLYLSEKYIIIILHMEVHGDANKLNKESKFNNAQSNTCLLCLDSAFMIFSFYGDVISYFLLFITHAFLYKDF